jgi:hypothetical protein
MRSAKTIQSRPIPASTTMKAMASRSMSLLLPQVEVA